MSRIMMPLVGMLLAAGCCQCRTPVESGTRFAAEAFGPAVESGELPGVISVLYDDGLQETCCLGYADVEARRAITLDDPFQQCSQTKGFCGVTVAMLVEEGKLNLDDPVSKYIPEFRDLWVLASDTNGVRRLEKAKKTLTVRMCLNHTGGFGFDLPHYVPMGGWSRRMPLRSVALVAALIPLDFEPGTRVQYSNVGIDVGAAIVERVSGMRWEDFLSERIFKPLGMKSTTFWPTEDQLKRRIELYRYEKGKRAVKSAPSGCMQAPFNDDRVFPSAGAGLWTTARDQLRFYKMLMNLGVGENGVRILKDETVKNLLAVSSRPKSLGGYSLGLSAPVSDGEDAWFGHGGAWNSQCKVNWHRRQLHLLVAQTYGDGSRYIRELNAETASKFFKAKIDRSGVDAYTGRLK